MTPHKTGTYRDRHASIEFCRYCGKEGSELRIEPNCKLKDFFAEEVLTPFVSGIRKDDY